MIIIVPFILVLVVVVVYWYRHDPQGRHWRKQNFGSNCFGPWHPEETTTRNNYVSTLKYLVKHKIKN